MKPGKRVGAGRTAEVFEFGPGRVIKLLRPGFDETGLRLEANKTKEAASVGAPAPDVHGFEVIAGRLGVVFDHIEGPSLLDVLTSEPWRVSGLAREMGDIHCRILRTSSADLVDIKERLTSKIVGAASLGPDLRRKATDALLDLPDGSSVLHGDFHPGNILMSEPEPRVIDWIDATRGHPAADIARTSWLISPRAIPLPPGPKRLILVTLAQLVHRVYHGRVLRCSGTAVSEVRRWELPVLAGRISEDIEAEVPHLVAAVRRLAG